jgi:hypothetical protein
LCSRYSSSSSNTSVVVAAAACAAAAGINGGPWGATSYEKGYNRHSEPFLAFLGWN